MSFGIVFLGIHLPLFARLSLCQKRLRDIVTPRHSDAACTIYALTRPLPRSRRWVERVYRYKRLADPEIDRQIQKLSRAETLLGWAIAVPLACGLVFWLVFMAISVA